MKITSMKIYFLTMLLSLFFLGACDKMMKLYLKMQMRISSRRS